MKTKSLKIFILFLAIVLFTGSSALFLPSSIETSALSSKNELISLQKEVNSDNTATTATSKKYWLVNVKFSDSTDFEEDFTEILKRTFTTSKQSVKEYFKTVSEGKYDFDADFLSETAVVLDKPQNYYEPKYHHISGNLYTLVNQNGYDNRYFDEEGNPCSSEKEGAKRHIDRLLRERELIKAICLKVEKSEKILDSDGDGIIDGISFIIKSEGDDFSWDDLLWPHRSTLNGYSEQLLNQYFIPNENEVSPLDFLPVKINEKSVFGYTLFTTEALSKQNIKDSDGNAIYSPSLVCHEYMHDLGIADYYAYNGDGSLYSDEPVGELDIMGGVGILPQMPLSYTRYRLGFIGDENIEPVVSGGRYTLFPTTTSSKIKALKLVLNDYDETGEYFMIEARTSDGSFVDGTLSGSGIVVYRIDEKNAYYDYDGSLGTQNLGNMYGGNEVYVFRINHGVLKDASGFSYALLNGKNTKISLQSSNNFADNSTIGNLDKSAYKTVIDPNSGLLVTSLCYENGNNSGILLSNITSNADGSFSFDLNFDEIITKDFSAQIKRHYNNKNYLVTWSGAKRDGDVKIYLSRTEGILRYKNGEYLLKKSVSQSMLESGNVYENEAVFINSTAASYGQAILANTTETVAVFAVCDGKVYYVGVLNPVKPTFTEYLFGTTKWLAMIISLLVILVLSVAGVIIYSVIKEKRKMQNAEPDVDLSSVYGENYWMNQGDDEPNGADGETTDDENDDENSDGEKADDDLKNDE